MGRPREPDRGGGVARWLEISGGTLWNGVKAARDATERGGRSGLVDEIRTR